TPAALAYSAELLARSSKPLRYESCLLMICKPAEITTQGGLPLEVNFCGTPTKNGYIRQAYFRSPRACFPLNLRPNWPVAETDLSTLGRPNWPDFSSYTVRSPAHGSGDHWWTA